MLDDGTTAIVSIVVIVVAIVGCGYCCCHSSPASPDIGERLGVCRLIRLTSQQGSATAI